MEDALAPCENEKINNLIAVLILVVMEDALAQAHYCDAGSDD